MFIAGIVLIALVSLLWYRSAGHNRSDEQILLDAANLFPNDHQTIILKQDSTYQHFSTDSEFTSMGARLSQHFHLPAGQISHDADGHLIYSAKDTAISGTEYSLYLAGLQDKTAYLIYQVQITTPTTPQDIHTIRLSMEKQLKDIGVPIHWNIMIQEQVGKISVSDSSSLFLKIAKALRAQQISTYTDSGSKSISYHSDILLQQPTQGQVNVQAAVHQDSVTGITRLTMGVPMISIEF